MKSMKKLLLVGLVLLASVIVLVGCDTNAGDTPSSTGGTTQQPGSEGTGGESANKAEDLTLTIGDASGSPMSVTLEDTDSDGYYEIGTANELYAFAAAVNDEGKTTIKGKLTSSIEVNKTVLDEQGNLSENVRPWTPIGNGDTPYTGIFDGADKTIKGLYFNDTNADYAGLFGYLEKGGSVQNLGVENSYFCGGMYVGGVVGSNYGTVTDCDNTGDVSGTATGEGSDCYVGGVVGANHGAVRECYNEGSVSGTATYCYVGGVMGYNDGDVSNCYNEGTVRGTATYCSVGGVVGYTEYAVSNCYNTGDVTGEGSACRVGGVVGENSGQVTTCYNTGSVIGTSEGSAGSVGGVVGFNGGDVSECFNEGSVSGTAPGEDAYCSVGGVVGENWDQVNACYNTGDVIGTSEGFYCFVGGVVGQNYEGAVTTCYNTGSVSGTGEGSLCSVGGVVGYNYSDNTVTTCYYLSGTAEKGVGNDNGTVEAKDETSFASEGMAEFLNDNQEDGPWEYISGKSAPTLKVFNKG